MKPRATALIFRNGKVLLTRERGTNVFGLPGGGIQDPRTPPISHACFEVGRKLELSPFRATRLHNCDFEAKHYKHYVTLVEIEDDNGLTPALEVLKKADYHREFADDPEKAEYFVKVRWLDTLPLNKAFHETGFFGQQNSVCKPTTPKWRHTTDRLKDHFTKWEG